MVCVSFACGGSRSEDEQVGSEETGASTEVLDGSTSTSSDGSAESSVGATEADEDTGSDDTQGEPPQELCGEGPWTCIPTDPTGPYGSRTFDVPAAQNWVNTGLYLEAGQTATITEDGSWFVNAGEGNAIDHGPCVIGDLVARIGLHYKDPALTCVHGSATFVADKSGILFVGGLPENDLGEVYEARIAAMGHKTVTVTSEGATVPTVEAFEAADYPYALVTSGWVEIRGAHTILTLPTATALQDAAVLADSVERIDLMYELEEELRGAVPQHGQRIRFFPDATVESFAYMLAGNPVRMVPVLVDAGFADRISQLAMPGVDNWGVAHELGHDFTFVGRLWWYQENSLEAWPNLFSIYVFEALGLPLHQEIAGCSTDSAPMPYVANWNPWAGLCFLMQFQYRYGWSFYETFFDQLNALDPASVPSGPAAWTFNHDRFEAIAGEDITPIFQAWGVPNPG